MLNTYNVSPSPDSLNMSCSGVKMFLVPRSSILAAWAGASLRPGLCSAVFSASLEADTEELVVEVETLLTIMESRERLILGDIMDVEQTKVVVKYSLETKVPAQC